MQLLAAQRQEISFNISLNVINMYKNYNVRFIEFKWKMNACQIG